MNVMLLSAGEGVRLRPYTLQMPKPAIPFLGAPLASYSLNLLASLKIHNLVVNTFHLPEKIETLFRDLNPKCDRLYFSSESTGLLGSGGGIHKAKGYLMGRGTFLVMNADEVILPHDETMMSDFIKAHELKGGIATLLTMNHPGVGQQFGGAWTLPPADAEDIYCSQQVAQFSKTSPGPQYRGHHFIGAMLFSDRIFHYFKDQVETENILYETLTKAMTAGESAYVHDVSCEWYETGNSKDFLHATDQVLSAFTNNVDSVWLRNLKDVVSKYGGSEPLIEKENPEILRSVSGLLKLGQS
jgi:mannose-1-phosphate guanylyltransferase